MADLLLLFNSVVFHLNDSPFFTKNNCLNFVPLYFILLMNY